MKKPDIDLGKQEKGFSFIEITVVLLVIATLAGMAILAYTNFLKKAKTVEAERILGTIAKQESAFHSIEGEYTASQALLGIPNSGALKYYTFTIIVPAGPMPQSYIATATGNIDLDATEDVWTINQDRALNHLIVD